MPRSAVLYIFALLYPTVVLSLVVVLEQACSLPPHVLQYIHVTLSLSLCTLHLLIAEL